MNLKNLFTRLSALLVLVFLVAGTVSAADFWVDPTGGFDSNPGTSGSPWATIEKAYRDAPSGSTIHLRAGIYNRNESGTGGGRDDNGYEFGTGLTAAAKGKSMTFVVETFAANNTVTFSTGAFVVDIDNLDATPDVITFQPATAGTHTITLSGASWTLASGTMDVSAFDATSTFDVTGAVLTITRTNGSLVGDPDYALANRNVIYNGTAAVVQTAGNEIPDPVGTLTLSRSAGSLVIPQALNFVFTGGGITSTTGNTATFQGLVTLTNPFGGAVNLPTITNANAVSWTFSGGIDVETTNNNTAVASDQFITSSAGTINVTGALTIEQLNGLGAVDADHYVSIMNTGGTIGLTGGVSQVSTGITVIYTVSRTPHLALFNTVGTYNLGGAAVVTTINGFDDNGTPAVPSLSQTGAGITNILGPVTMNSRVNLNGTLNLNANTLTLTSNFVGAGRDHDFTGDVNSTGVGSGWLKFTNTVAIAPTGTGDLPNVETNAGDFTTLTDQIDGHLHINGAGDVVANSLAGALAIEGNLIAQGGGADAGDFSSTGVFTIGGDVRSLSALAHITANAVTGVGDSVQTTNSGDISLTGVNTNIPGSVLSSGSGDIDLPLASGVSGNVTASGTGDIDLTAALSVGGSVTASGIGADIDLNSATNITGDVSSIGLGSTVDIDMANSIGGDLIVGSTGTIDNDGYSPLAGTISGDIVTNLGSLGSIVTDVTNLVGDVIMNGGANVFFNSAIPTGILFQGDVTIAGGIFWNSIEDLLITGSVTMSGGIFRIGDNNLVAQEVTTVQGNWTQTGGQVDYVENVLDFKGTTFSRTSGSVVPTWLNGTYSAIQRFSGGTTQTFTGGSNMAVFDLEVTINGTKVVLDNGTIIVNGDALISAGTSMDMGTNAVRMVGSLLGVSPNDGGLFTNAGSFTATLPGGVYFETTGTVAVGEVTGQMDGAGLYGPVDIRLDDEYDLVDLGPSSPNITFGDDIIIRKGGINIGNAESLRPTNVPVAPAFPKIWRNVEDVNNDGFSDGKSFTFVGTGVLNPFNFAYDLEYFTTNSPAQGFDGTLATPNVDMGNEFQTGNVRNLDISAVANPAGSATIRNFGAKTFNGDLTVVDDAILLLEGGPGSDLTASGTAHGTSTTHTIDGSVLSANVDPNTEEFIVLGSAITAANNAGTEATIENLTVNSAVNTVTITNMKHFGSGSNGGLNIVLGTVSLGMYSDGVAEPWTFYGDIWNYNQSNNTTVTLTTDVEIINKADFAGGAANVINFGTFDFRFETTGGTFEAQGNEVANGTTGGLVFYNSTAGAFAYNLQAGQGGGSAMLMPNITIYDRDDVVINSPVTVSLAGINGGGVKTSFSNTSNQGTLALGTSNFTFGSTATTWNTTGNYTGTSGTIVVLGPVTANLSGSISVPNLTVNNGANTFTLSSGTERTVTVDADFTLSSGTVAQGAHDILVEDDFTYGGGTITQTSSLDKYSAANSNAGTGEFRWSGDGFIVNAAGLDIPHLRIEANITEIAGTTGQLTVSKYLEFGALGGIDVETGEVLNISAGALIIRTGAGTVAPSGVPLGTINNAGAIDLSYLGDYSAATNSEFSASINNLIVNVGPTLGRAVTLSTSTTVNNNLEILQGDLSTNIAPNARTITMGASSTVLRDFSLTASPDLLGDNSLAGGPITLIYRGTAGDLTTQANEFPSTAGFVDLLVVDMGNAVGPVNRNLNYQGGFSRSVGDLDLQNNTVASLFHLQGGSLTVEAADANLTMGTMTGSTLYFMGNLVTSANVIFSSGSLDLIVDGTTDYNNTGTLLANSATFGGTADIAGTLDVNLVQVNGAGNDLLIGGNLDLNGGIAIVNDLLQIQGNLIGGDVQANQLWVAGTTTGDVVIGTGGASFFDDFTGTADVAGDVNIEAGFTSELEVGGNLTLGPSGLFDPSTVLTFDGAADQQFNSPFSQTVDHLFINQVGAPAPHVIMSDNSPNPGWTLFVTGGASLDPTVSPNVFDSPSRLHLINGILETQGGNDVFLVSNAQGFIRANGVNSHVFGRVTKHWKAGSPSLLSSDIEGLKMYPVGGENDYDPFSFVFTNANLVQTTNNVTVEFVDMSPGGTNFDSANNPDGIDSTADFFWRVITQFTLSQSQVFDAIAEAAQWTNPADYSDVQDIKLVSRLDGNVANQWKVLPGSYANFETGSPVHPVMQLSGTFAPGGIPSQGRIFTLGSFRQSFNVSGTVTYANLNAAPVQNATVTLTPTAGAPVVTTTDANGDYTAVVGNGDFTVTVSKADATVWSAPSISIADAFLAAQHGASMVTLTGLPLLAGNVNNSGNGAVNASDALLIAYRAIGHINGVFSIPTWIFSSPGVVTVNGASVSGIDAQGILAGDVNASSLGAFPKASSSSVTLNNEEVLKVNPKESFEVAVNASEEMKLGAFRMVYTYPSELVTLESVSSSLGEIISIKEDGKVTVAWIDATGGASVSKVGVNQSLLNFKFKPTELFVEGSNFSVNADAEGFEFVDAAGENIGSVVLKSVKVEGFIPKVFALDQNYPNPFNPSTTIQFSVPENAKVKLVIYNALGQEVMTLVNGIMEAGQYRSQFNAGSIASGVYLYRIDVETANTKYTDTKTMVLIK